MTEIEAAGIGFEIDHYLPKERFPQLTSDYNNLMWSCERCNGCKSDYSPDAEDEENGYVVLKIDQSDPQDHLELNDLLLEAKTKTGEFNIQRLDLNRRQLLRIRELRERLSEADGYIAFGVQQLMSIRLDKISPKLRLPFLNVKGYIFDRYKVVEESRDSLLRQFARSPLLDTDPDQKERRKKAKRYLRGIKAIIPRDM
jgi:hypothetical protein